MRYSKHLKVTEPTQREPLPGMTRNNAGGYSYEVDEWNRLRRFLIIGTEGGSYYVDEFHLTRQNARHVMRLLERDPKRVIDEAVSVSTQGLARSNDPALFVLALALSGSNQEAKLLAERALPLVARTGTHILHFAAMIDDLRGWGRAVRRAIGNWYRQKDLSLLGYQLAKYQSRDGWSHRDVLRSVHIRPRSEHQSRLFAWAVGKYEPQSADEPGFRYIYGMRLAHTAEDDDELVRIIREYQLEREHVPTRFLKSAKVWEALLPNLKYEALIRNLGNMSACGLLVPGSEHERYIAESIADRSNVVRSRIHPIKVLSAWYVYGSGGGYRGRNSWVPCDRVVDALSAAFYASFRNVVPVGKRLLLALDVSGSMTFPSPVPGLTCRDIAAVMAMVTARLENDFTVVAFQQQLTELDIRADDTLKSVIDKISNLPFGGTDCALPALWALDRKERYDGIVIYTDSETWYGDVHPSRAIGEYRRTVSPQCRQVVVGMEANEFSIAAPNDLLSLDVVGFSGDTPDVISSFLRGEF